MNSFYIFVSVLAVVIVITVYCENFDCIMNWFDDYVAEPFERLCNRLKPE